MSNSKVIASSLLIPIFLLASGIAEAFSDVKAENAHYMAIEYLRENGIIEGYIMNGDNTFKPKQNISRAEALKIFLLASKTITDTKAVINENKESPLSDVPANSWFAPYISIAKEKNIITGYDDGSFKPENPINLAESLKMYFEAINTANDGQIDFEASINENFIDVAPDAWFSKYTSYAGFRQIINIYSDNTINPNQLMTRGYLAEIIYRTIQNKEGLEFGKATYYFGIPGKENDSYDQELMTTAHQTLPKGTILQVTNLANGKSVKVKITDRGPYGPGRVLDLSKKAFAKIASPSEGVINIQFVQVSPEI